MNHSFSNLLLHIVFSTKGRRSLLTADVRPRLFAYMGGILRDVQCKPIIIGGIEDHVHLLIGFTVNDSIAHIMSVLKSNSSRWMHDEMNKCDFQWQRGYAAFSVSQSVSGIVEQYIGRQEEHHKRKTFREEFSEFLRLNGVKDIAIE